jgi:hypothetical protein
MLHKVHYSWVLRTRVKWLTASLPKHAMFYPKNAAEMRIHGLTPTAAKQNGISNCLAIKGVFVKQTRGRNALLNFRTRPRE